MCTTCGCGGDDAVGAPHEHVGLDGVRYRHAHSDGHAHVHAHAPGSEGGQPSPEEGRPVRRLEVEQDILAKNDTFAASNRRRFEQDGVLALNLVSSPGSGKTSLLVRTIEALQGRVPMAVIEGDQQTSLDADRIRETGVRAVQINTGRGCHLDAHRVQQALDELEWVPASVLFIENVGNLVCPAGFDLGEAAKVVILSVTEGEDKPLKYPDMFRAARVLLINKCDLLPYLQFDLAQVIANARRVNPQITILQVSAQTGAGLAGWIDWIGREQAAIASRQEESLVALKRRVAELEAQLRLLPAVDAS